MIKTYHSLFTSKNKDIWKNFLFSNLLLLLIMSTQIESRPAIELPGEREEAPISPGLQKQFLAHFKLYSLVNSTRDIIFMIPFVRQCATNISPSFQAIRDSNPIRAVMDKGDPIADGALNKLDSVAPNLRKYAYSNLWASFTRPVNGTLGNTRRVLTNGNEAIKTTIIEPSAKTVHDLRDRFHYVVYDNNGKGIITSTADPLVAPLNDYLENIVKCSPTLKSDSKNHSSELSRTVQIVVNAVRGNIESTEELDNPKNEYDKLKNQYVDGAKDTIHEKAAEHTQ